MDWKNFYIKYRWMPTKLLVEKFGINKYDVDNFLRKPNVRSLFDGWKLSLSSSPENIQKILESAWEYYLTYEKNIDLSQPSEDWIPKFLSLSGTSHEEGFSFLVSSKYLKIVNEQQYNEYKKHGFTNTAFGLFHFFPKKDFLFSHGILPFMFYQTQKKVTEFIDILSMIEHVYMNFYDFGTSVTDVEKKEIFIARYNEPNFVNRSFLGNYGITQHFYLDYGGLRYFLDPLAQKYLVELGYEKNIENGWSRREFIKQHPSKEITKCRYCGLQPIDLHHLLPRNEYPQYGYNAENVVPLCVNVHAFITRRKWDENQEVEYKSLYKRWLKEPNIGVFDDIMNQIHEYIYGEKPKGISR